MSLFFLTKFSFAGPGPPDYQALELVVVLLVQVVYRLRYLVVVELDVLLPGPLEPPGALAALAHLGVRQGMVPPHHLYVGALQRGYRRLPAVHRQQGVGVLRLYHVLYRLEQERGVAPVDVDLHGHRRLHGEQLDVVLALVLGDVAREDYEAALRRLAVELEVLDYLLERALDVGARRLRLYVGGGAVLLPESVGLLAQLVAGGYVYAYELRPRAADGLEPLYLLDHVVLFLHGQHSAMRSICHR